MGKIEGYYLMAHPPVMIPEVGKGDEKTISETTKACIRVSEEVKRLAPDTIIVITPHGPVFRDAVAISMGDSIEGSLKRFGASDVSMKYEINMEITSKIMEKASKSSISFAEITKSSVKDYNINFELDHGTIVPLYYINKAYKNFKIVHVTYGLLSSLELYRFGKIIKEAVEETGSRAVFIASGDLSHKLTPEGPYGYDPNGPVFDREILRLLKEGDIKGVFSMDKQLVEKSGECGLRSVYILSGTLEGKRTGGEIYSYEGPFGVGYGIVSMKVNGDMDISVEKEIEEGIKKEKEELRLKREEERKREDLYVKLARESVEYYTKLGKVIPQPDYATYDMLNQKNGVFVSIKKGGNLRGCIGTISPVRENVAEEIIRNAIEACSRDPRFYPITEEELEELDISVDVLMAPVKAEKAELDPSKYGIILRSGSKSGLLLPDLDGVDTIDQQIEITLKKAGIKDGENYTIEKFEVIRHK